MILDTLDWWKDYNWGNDRFRAAFEYLEKLDPETEDGTYPSDGEDVYCIIQSYETTSEEPRGFEAHRDYADIQYIIGGEESLLWAPAPGLTVVIPYTPDVEGYALIPDPTELVLTPGRFCALFPQDAHVPGVAHGDPCLVRKAVMKVRLG